MKCLVVVGIAIVSLQLGLAAMDRGARAVAYTQVASAERESKWQWKESVRCGDIRLNGAIACCLMCGGGGYLMASESAVGVTCCLLSAIPWVNVYRNRRPIPRPQ